MFVLDGGNSANDSPDANDIEQLRRPILDFSRNSRMPTLLSLSPRSSKQTGMLTPIKGSFLMFMARTFGQQSSFIYVFGGQPAFAPAMKGFATASGNITSSPGN